MRRGHGGMRGGHGGQRAAPRRPGGCWRRRATATSPRLRRALPRSSFLPEAAEREVQSLFSGSDVESAGSTASPRLSLSLSRLKQAAGDESSSGRAQRAALVAQRARWVAPRRALEAVRYSDE
ncbi:Os11g0574249 [Oryza sativa Japonica Group]|uniref:Os11g0574249 protein n=1 Tax=Oryza sativa subsp. japonica TaxID=39947 RepID=A0A0P0Y3K0_ORYSJ|nr:Os11g0574249 [Oryza sativa Japonica Group]